MAASADLGPGPLDEVMRRLARSADHSVLWLVLAGVASARPGRSRRGAVRGLLAVAAASATANSLAKPLFPRGRPPEEGVAVARRLRKRPTSSSYPSGHAASAAAFVTGMALESPETAAVIAPVAAAVAYSRVHTGVHWPSDVVSGAVLGSGIALATRRWWATRPDDPANLGLSEEAPRCPGGDGLLIAVNPGSGAEDGAVEDELRQRLPRATVIRLGTDSDFRIQVDGHLRERDYRAIGVCGGDGTVQAMSEVAMRRGIPLAVFPGGTLNHFAQDTGIVDTESTARAVETGQAVLVDVAEVQVDDRHPTPFLNTASLGGYPDSVRLRDKWEPKLGKWPAAAAAMITVLSEAKPLTVTLDGEQTAVWMFFVGNGRYSPRDRVPMSRPDLHRGTLDIRYLRADIRFSRSKLVFAALSGTLGSSTSYVQKSIAAVDVEVHGPSIALATDGEAERSGSRFRFASRPGALTLYRTRVD